MTLCCPPGQCLNEPQCLPGRQCKAGDGKVAVAWRWRWRNDMAPDQPGPWHYSEDPRWGEYGSDMTLDVQALGVIK